MPGGPQRRFRFLQELECIPPLAVLKRKPALVDLRDRYQLRSIYLLRGGAYCRDVDGCLLILTLLAVSAALPEVHKEVQIAVE